MPNYQITSPTGEKFEITAPEGATEQQVMQFAQSNMRPEQKEPTLSERVGGGIMGAQQGISYGFGDELQAALTAGGAYALDKLNIDKLLTGKEYEKSFKETYEADLAKTRKRMAQAAEQTPIEYYGGQIAGGIATAPAALATSAGRGLSQGLRQGPLLSRALYGAAGGAVSGGAYGFGAGEGGFDKRMESARTASLYGGIGGGAVPIAGAGIRGIKNAILPQIDEALKPLAKRANDLGVPLSIDQLSPTKFRRTLQKISQEAPFSGVDDFTAIQRKAFNKALAKTIGQDADNLAPDVIEKFSRDASRKFSVLTEGVNINVGDDFSINLNKIVDDAFANSGDEIGNIVKRQAEQLLREMPAETLRGSRISAARSNIIAKLAGKKLNPQSKEYVKEMVDLIDNAVTPYLDDAKRATLQQARLEYRNFKTIEPLLEGSTDGFIDPTKLLNRVKSSPYIRASRTSVGKDELVDLARIGKEFLPIPGGSDTFQKIATAGGLGGGVVATVVEPLTAVFAATGIGLNRGLQKLYNQNPKLVQRLIEQGQKSGNFKPLIHASARQLGIKAANEDKINQNIIQRLARDERGNARILGATAAGAIAIPELMQNENSSYPDNDFTTNIPETIPDQSLLNVGYSNRSSLLDKIAMAESSGNPNAKSRTSSASGLFQFTDGTWRSMVKKYGAENGIKIKDKNNPDAQRVMAELLLEENAGILENKIDRAPNEGELYIAHFMGPARAAKLINSLSENPPAIRLVPREYAQANKSIFFDKGRPRRASEVYELLSGKVA